MNLEQTCALSLAPQVGELGAEVELIVSGNASTDEIEQVVKLASEYSRIQYDRKAENIGSGPNIIVSLVGKIREDLIK